MTLELSLNNFRCWESKDMTFPSSGICLINARSGRGKSSILNSILYAVTGKLKNITTINKKTTKVILKMDNFEIIRSRGPNRLSIQKDGKLYENDEAQCIINSIFGEFSNTSYIDQENTYSFVFLSPSEKMEFLEKLLLQNYDIEKLKDNLRVEISKSKNNYSTEESKINTLDSILQTIEIIDQKELIVEKIKVSKVNCEKIIEKIRSNQDISEKNIKVLKTKLKKLEEEQTVSLVKNERTKNLKFLLQDMKKNTLYLEISKIEYFKREMEDLEEDKKYYIKAKDFLLYKQKREELILKLEDLQEKNILEINNIQKEMAEVEKNSLSKEFSKKRIYELENCLTLINSIYSLENHMENDIDFEYEIRKETDILEKNKESFLNLQKKLGDYEKCYMCPSCQSTLKINENKLVLSSFLENIDPIIIKQEIDSLKADIKKSESSLSLIKKQQMIYQQNEQKYNNFFDQLDTLRGDVECDKESIKKELEYVSNYMELSDKIKILKDDKLIKSIQLDISDLTSKIDKIDISGNLYNKINTEEDYLYCIQKISTLKEKIQQLKSIDMKVNEIEYELTSIGGNKDEGKNYTEILFTEREKLESYISKNDCYKSYIEKLNNWCKENKEIERIQNIKKSIEEATKNKQYFSDRLRCLVKIRDHVKNAEQKCISEFIDSLNQHASMYIEEFFPDEDIKIELKTTQETKSTGKEKIALNFDLSYRQINGDLSYLSGGERDRVNLAFTLAFSEIINNRVLLLDECISSLDAETTNIVLESLKEKYKGKLVILVSHQANQGFFDRVIEL